MILAAVAYTQKRTQRLPIELEYAYHIEKYGPPWGDGWMEWPAGLPNRISTVRAYTRAFELYEANARRKGWVDANPGIYRLVTEVWRWRKDAGLPWM